MLLWLLMFGLVEVWESAQLQPEFGPLFHFVSSLLGVASEGKNKEQTCTIFCYLKWISWQYQHLIPNLPHPFRPFPTQLFFFSLFPKRETIFNTSLNITYKITKTFFYLRMEGSDLSIICLSFINISYFIYRN